MANPERGQIQIVVSEPAPRPAMRANRARPLAVGVGVLIIFLVGIWITQLIEPPPQPSTPISSIPSARPSTSSLPVHRRKPADFRASPLLEGESRDVSESFVQLPAKPQPRFAVITEKHRGNQAERHPQPQFIETNPGRYVAQLPPNGVLFERDRLEIRKITTPNDVPLGMRIGTRSAVPGFTHAEIVQASGAMIIYGDIQLHAGPLAEKDHWKAHFEVQNGQIVRALVDSSGESKRGPPQTRTRQIYVVGDITSFSGAEQYDQSTRELTIVDLSVTPALLRAYSKAVNDITALNRAMKEEKIKTKKKEEARRMKEERATEREAERPRIIPRR